MRRPMRRMFIFLLGLLPLLFAGCNDSASKSSPPASTGVNGSSTTEGEQNQPTAPIIPLADGWDKPAVALVISGEQHGYLEPCGCSETQSGGVARRHDMLKQLQSRDWPVVPLELGGTLKRARLQSQYKFDAILSALNIMQYESLNLGPEELSLGADSLLARHVPADGTRHYLPFLSANVTLYDTPELGTPIRHHLITSGVQKIGVVSYVSPALTKEVPHLSDPTTMHVADPIESITPAIEALRGESPTLYVLLAHADLEEAKRISDRYPEFQLIACAGGPEDGSYNPIQHNDAMLLRVGQKGKHVGLVGFYPDQAESLKYELVDLDKDRFANSTEMIEVMRAYQSRLKAENVAQREPTIAHPSGESFVGAKKCGECHKKAFATWKETKHAHAYESLVKGRPDYAEEFVPRIHDPECLVCHTTGWMQRDVIRYNSGFLDEATSAHLMGQQCENCHGPGSHHTSLEESYKADRKSVAMEELLQGRRDVQLTEIKAVKEVCIRCHDYDNSPNFDFEKYWPKVKHVGRD